MSVWLCIPSARKPEEANPVFRQWRERGYKVAVFRNPDAPAVESDLSIFGPYSGYPKAVNRLVRHVIFKDPGVEWFVIGGDDITPDPKADPQRIANECRDRFAGTNGVMQPCGDAYGALKDRTAAVSAWIGRAFQRLTYGGMGPLWEGYTHYYDDAELAAVATSLSRMWWRDDLTQYHAHYLRNPGQVIPDHLIKWQYESPKSKAVFDLRRRQGFPGATNTKVLKGYQYSPPVAKVS